MKKSYVIALGLAIFAAVVAGGIWYVNETNQNPIEFGMVVEPARELEQFTLQRADGQVVHREDFTGHWTLLTFGFTNCPDVCPTALGFFKKELELLDGERDNIEFAFVSVDPERDTLEKLASYVGYFHPAIKAYTGTGDELKKLTGMLGSYFAKEPGKTKGEYSVAHSPYFFLINPDGEWQAFYRMPLSRGKLATDLSRLAHKGKTLF